MQNLSGYGRRTRARRVLAKIQKRRERDHKCRRRRNHARTDGHRPQRFADAPPQIGPDGRGHGAFGRLRNAAPPDARHGAGPGEHRRRDSRPAGGHPAADDSRTAVRQAGRAFRNLSESGNRRILRGNGSGTRGMPLDSRLLRRSDARAADRAALPRRTVRRTDGAHRRLHGRHFPARGPITSTASSTPTGWAERPCSRNRAARGTKNSVRNAFGRCGRKNARKKRRELIQSPSARHRWRPSGLRRPEFASPYLHNRS